MEAPQSRLSRLLFVTLAIGIGVLIGLLIGSYAVYKDIQLNTSQANVKAAQRYNTVCLDYAASGCRLVR